jgi:hypothetical protein
MGFPNDPAAFEQAEILGFGARKDLIDHYPAIIIAAHNTEEFWNSPCE